MSQGSPLMIGGGSHIVVAGAPLSGKSTIAKRIAQELGLQYVSSGDIVREMATEWKDLAKELREGRTIDSVRIDNAILKRLEEIGVGGFVIDGFPRFTGQYYKLFLNSGIRMELMVWVDTIRELALSNGKARGRSDDTAELVNRRWQWFERDTRPVWLLAQTLRTVPVLNFFNLTPGTLDESMTDFVEATRAVLPSRIVKPGSKH